MPAVWWYVPIIRLFLGSVTRMSHVCGWDILVEAGDWEALGMRQNPSINSIFLFAEGKNVGSKHLTRSGPKKIWSSQGRRRGSGSLSGFHTRTVDLLLPSRETRQVSGF